MKATIINPNSPLELKVYIPILAANPPHPFNHLNTNFGKEYILR